jgi:hypothetical protein
MPALLLYRPTMLAAAHGSSAVDAIRGRLAGKPWLPIILRGCGHFGMIFIPRSYRHTEVDTGRIITTLEEKLISILAGWIWPTVMGKVVLLVRRFG